jgi:hypothetical protein
MSTNTRFLNFFDRVKYFGLRKIYYILKNQFFLINENIKYVQQNILPGANRKRPSLRKGKVNKFDKSYFIGAGSNYEICDYPLALLEKMFLKVRLKNLSKYAKRIKGQRILDIGCANDLFVNYLRENDLVAYGIDISRDAIRESKEFKGIKTHVCDAVSLRYPYKHKYFDLLQRLT